MREIKFRAWDKKLNRMWQEELLSLPVSDLLYREDLEIMQFTGLKDKSGKEIYEGDIVAIPSSETEEITDDGRGPTEDYSQLKPVIFDKGSFGVLTDKDDCFYKDFNTLTDIDDTIGEGLIEIIGNIYENPELLN